MRVLGKFVPLGNRQICMNRYINPKIYNLTQNQFLPTQAKTGSVKQDYPPREVIVCESHMMV